MKHPTDLKQLPFLVKHLAQVLPAGHVLMDFGAGTGSKSGEHASASGLGYHAYDPFIKSDDFERALDLPGEKVVCCSNVLNVLDECTLSNVERKLLSWLAAGKCKALAVSVYEGDKSEERRGHQNNQPRKWYAERLEDAARLACPEFSVSRIGKVIWVHKGLEFLVKNN